MNIHKLCASKAKHMSPTYLSNALLDLDTKYPSNSFPMLACKLLDSMHRIKNLAIGQPYKAFFWTELL